MSLACFARGGVGLRLFPVVVPSCIPVAPPVGFRVCTDAA